MKFQTEIQLVKLLIELLKNKYRQEYVEIFEEVSLGYGIADLVVTQLTMPKSMINKADNYLDANDINIYNIIKCNGDITIEEIINITRSSKRQIFESIEKLLKKKHVGYKNGTFSVDNIYQLPFKTNFAIEAKLKDWRRGLNQAYRYRWFAEYSYVVIDVHHSKKAIDNIETFKKYNVGLATISSEGKLERHFKPKRKEPFDKKMQILLSEKIQHVYEVAR